MATYTGLVSYHGGESIEEIDVEADDYNAARAEIQRVMKADYEPGGKLMEVQGPIFGMRLWSLPSLPQLHVTRMHFIRDGSRNFGQIVYETDDGYLVLRGYHADAFAMGLAAGRAVPLDIFDSWDEWRDVHAAFN